MDGTSRNRQTLAESTSWIDGHGLHSGRPSRLRIHPNEAGRGIAFQHAITGQRLPAAVGTVIGTERATELGLNGFHVQTVEHLLSALAGLGVDDACVEVDGVELPAVDGSALPYVECIQGTGLAQSSQPIMPLRLPRPVMVSDDSGASLVALPSDHFSVTVILDYPDRPYLQTLAADYDSAMPYAQEVAPARTYGFLSELEWLHSHGLGLGATMDNVVVLDEDKYVSDLRFPNELPRHKILDVIGDLSLIGRPLCARILALKPSHALNVRLARRLFEVLPPSEEI